MPSKRTIYTVGMGNLGREIGRGVSGQATRDIGYESLEDTARIAEGLDENVQPIFTPDPEIKESQRRHPSQLDFQKPVDPDAPQLGTAADITASPETLNANVDAVRAIKAQQAAARAATSNVVHVEFHRQ